MNRKTRYFVIASLLVLTVGVGTGMVAYYVGFPTAFAQQGPDELQLVPGNAVVVAYANVHEVMVSNLRERIRQAMPHLPDGQREFEDATGINIETDVDRVVAALVPPADGRFDVPRSGLFIATGRFDQVRIEALMREHGASEETYKGRRLFVAQHDGVGHVSRLCRARSGGSRRRPAGARGHRSPGWRRQRQGQRRHHGAGSVARPRQRVGRRPLRRADLASQPAAPDRRVNCRRLPGSRSAGT